MMSSGETIDRDDGLQAARAALVEGDIARARAMLDQLGDDTARDPDVHYLEAATRWASGDAAGEAALSKARHGHALAIIEAAGGDLARLATDPTYALGVGREFYRAKQMAPAAVAFGYASSLPGGNMLTALQLHAEALHYEGRTEEAALAFAAAFRLDPTPHRHSFALYALFFLEDGVQRHAAEARRWGQLWADTIRPLPPVAERRPPGDRPLRVGYVAPSFTTNQTQMFVEPLLEAHDPAAVEVFLYVEDAMQERVAPHIHTRSTGRNTPEEVAQQVRDDRIDILVDVWGHASRNILQVFAYEPAPVQVSWLNYLQTTGLRQMDAVLHGDFMDAPGKAAAFREAIWDLGPVTGLFRPNPGAVPSPAPALAKGYVTFASFNHPAKIGPETITAWASILKGCPASRLTFKYAPYIDVVLQSQIQARFLGHGIAPERLQFEGHGLGEEYERAFAEIDLALDPSPCPGGTTTLQAFSRGVPVLTLDSGDFYARIGVQPLMALGLPELIADDWDDYVERAVALARDPARLAALRAEIRPRFDASSYRDEPGFARRLEAVYRQLSEEAFVEHPATVGEAA